MNEVVQLLYPMTRFVDSITKTDFEKASKQIYYTHLVELEKHLLVKEVKTCHGNALLIWTIAGLLIILARRTTFHN